MKKYDSESQVLQIIKTVANTVQVGFTNEGFEVMFTTSDKNQKQIADDLKKVFSDVRIKGRKNPSILVNRVSLKSDRGRVLEVEY